MEFSPYNLKHPKKECRAAHRAKAFQKHRCCSFFPLDTIRPIAKGGLLPGNLHYYSPVPRGSCGDIHDDHRTCRVVLLNLNDAPVVGCCWLEVSSNWHWNRNALMGPSPNFPGIHACRRGDVQAFLLVPSPERRVTAERSLRVRKPLIHPKQ